MEIRVGFVAIDGIDLTFMGALLDIGTLLGVVACMVEGMYSWLKRELT